MTLLTLLASPQTQAERVREAVAGVFLDLPAERQASLLQYEWRTIAGPKMLPVVRGLAKAAAQPELADAALRRLYELDPGQGLPFVLEAIRNPPAGATLRALGRLPDRELSQLDDILAANVEPDLGFEALSIRAELVHRYASPAVSARVLGRVAHVLPGLACRPKAALLAYFLRADPERGAKLLDDALATRADTGCFRMLLPAVARLRMAPAVEAAALAHLDDPDAEVAASAINTLGESGSKAAREPLRRRFERWHDEWQGRAEALGYSHAQQRPDVLQASVEFALYSALGRGRAWLSGPDDLRALRALCVTETCRVQVGHVIDAAQETRIGIVQFDGPDDCLVTVAQYELASLAALERKLLQYPEGTTFVLDVAPLDPQSASLAVDVLMKFAAASGITLRR